MSKKYKIIEWLDEFCHTHRRLVPTWFLKIVCNAWDNVNGLWDDLDDLEDGED